MLLISPNNKLKKCPLSLLISRSERYKMCELLVLLLLLTILAPTKHNCFYCTKSSTSHQCLNIYCAWYNWEFLVKLSMTCHIRWFRSPKRNTQSIVPRLTYLFYWDFGECVFVFPLSEAHCTGIEDRPQTYLTKVDPIYGVHTKTTRYLFVSMEEIDPQEDINVSVLASALTSSVHSAQTGQRKRTGATNPNRHLRATLGSTQWAVQLDEAVDCCQQPPWCSASIESFWNWRVQFGEKQHGWQKQITYLYRQCQTHESLDHKSWFLLLATISTLLVSRRSSGQSDGWAPSHTDWWPRKGFHGGHFVHQKWAIWTSPVAGIFGYKLMHELDPEDEYICVKITIVATMMMGRRVSYDTKAFVGTVQRRWLWHVRSCREIVYSHFGVVHPMHVAFYGSLLISTLSCPSWAGSSSSTAHQVHCGSSVQHGWVLYSICRAAVAITIYSLMRTKTVSVTNQSAH